MAFHHLLVPVDFTDASNRALDLAVDLATRIGAKVSILHAYQIPSYTFPEGAFIPSIDLVKGMTDAASRQLSELVARRSTPTLKLESHLVSGNAAEAVIDTAQKIGADAIVMGAHGAGAFERALLGSVASKVIRLAPIPVISVRGTRAPSAPPGP